MWLFKFRCSLAVCNFRSDLCEFHRHTLSSEYKCRVKRRKRKSKADVWGVSLPCQDCTINSHSLTLRPWQHNPATRQPFIFGIFYPFYAILENYQPTREMTEWSLKKKTTQIHLLLALQTDMAPFTLHFSIFLHFFAWLFLAWLK